MTRYLAPLIAILFSAQGALADTVSFTDPQGDDTGPGSYIYPSNPVFQPGAFDLRRFSVTPEGDRLRLDFVVAAPLQNAWDMAGGFDVQMFFVFIDTGPGGHTAGLPGLNIAFADDHAWDKAIVVSPQPYDRVVAEIGKAGVLEPDVIAAQDVTGSGNTVTAYIPATAIAGSPGDWAYQVIVQSNEGFPEATDLLTRRVNAFEEEYRFGGGDDGNCDPHVIDILGPHDQLAYDCGVGFATLRMLRP